MTPAQDILQSRVPFLNNELLTKATAAQNEVAFSYHIVRGLYFLAVVFAANIVIIDDIINVMAMLCVLQLGMHKNEIATTF